MSTTTKGRIPPDTYVEWDSQAYGGWKRKRGHVLGYVAPEADAWALVPSAWREVSSRIKFQQRSQKPRYVVEVADRRGRPTYYAPLASVLEKDNPGAVRT